MRRTARDARPTLVLSTLLAALAPAAAAQAFRPGFESAGANGGVWALCVFDDGGGPKLHAAGEFDAAGTAAARGVARWNAVTGSWSGLGAGVEGRVGALCVFDEDGAGPLPARLYAGGLFQTAGGAPARHVARWDGATWTPLGLGPGLDGPATALTAFDEDGSGPARPELYAGGYFSHADGLPANQIARWSGSQWRPVANGVDGSFSAPAVTALGTFDEDGSGPAPARLYVGGSFSSAGPTAAQGVARWDGVNLLPLASGVNAPGSFPGVRALASFDDGAGTKLYAAGLFRAAGTATATSDALDPNPLLVVARWDGFTWTPLGAGLATNANGAGRALLAFDDDGNGVPSLFVAGQFTAANGAAAAGVLRWSGAAWQPLGSGRGADRDVLAFAAPPGAGAPLLVGGSFTTAGPIRANRVALWNDAAQSWQPLGLGLDDTVRALELHGGSVFAGGDFTTSGGAPARHVALFTGASWIDVGGGTDGPVHALRSWQGLLVAGGEFRAAGGLSAGNVAAWTGAAWQPLLNGTDDVVRALEVFDESGGGAPRLFAGGDFRSAGGAPAVGVARWDGAAWTPVGEGLCCGGVRDLAVFDDGNGARLYAAGDFDVHGALRNDGVARWNAAAQQWEPLGAGFSGGRPTLVAALAPAVIGGLPALVAGGDFQLAGGVPASRIARWNGSAWSPFGAGMDDVVRALRSQPVGAGVEALFAGGSFTLADGRPSARFARSN